MTTVLKRPESPEPKPESPSRLAARARLEERRKLRDKGRFIPRFASLSDAAATGRIAVGAEPPQYREAPEIIDARGLKDLGIRETAQPGRNPRKHRWLAGPDGTGYQILRELVSFETDNPQRLDEVVLRFDQKVPSRIDLDARGGRTPHLDEIRERYFKARIHPAGTFEVA